MAGTIRRAAALKALVQALRASGRPGAPGIGERLAAVPRMLSMGLTGRYPHLARGRLLLAGLGLLYVLSPIDVLPEALLWVVGLGDDALVAAWIAGAVLGEAEVFLSWEREHSTLQTRVVTGEVIG